jgi:uncharacterized protein
MGNLDKSKNVANDHESEGGSMNNKTISGMKCILALLGLLALALPAQAASFDCAKAGTKVEKLICGDAVLSKLDDELSVSYKGALQDHTKADAIKQSQKQWLRERNNCKDAECVKAVYRNRERELVGETDVAGAPAQAKAKSQVKQPKVASPGSANKETYALVMSKNDEMCNHMRQLMNDDLKLFERTYDSHDRFVSGIEEFDAIPWRSARASSEHVGRVDYTDVEGALFDLNNDGVQDFVVRYRGTLSGMRADGLYILDSSAASRANALTFKELFGSNNQIALAGSGYTLKEPLVGRNESLWLLSPFIYHGVSYVYMQSLYKKDEAIGGDFVVIAKFIGGKLDDGNLTGMMEDICYIKRDGVKTK